MFYGAKNENRFSFLCMKRHKGVAQQPMLGEST
jgi:hypothetical protein